MVRGRHETFNLVLSDETNTTLPVGWGVVQNVVYREAILVFLRKLIQFSAQQDILDVNVGIYECELGTVQRVLQSCTDDLEHGRNSGPPSDHAQFA